MKALTRRDYIAMRMRNAWCRRVKETWRDGQKLVAKDEVSKPTTSRHGREGGQQSKNPILPQRREGIGVCKHRALPKTVTVHGEGCD
jgi:hypothetical protein